MENRLRSMELRAIPAPWEVRGGAEGDFEVYGADDHGGYFIASCGEEAGPNAHLIAAMRNALPGLLDELAHYRTFLKEVEEALLPGRWRGFGGPDAASAGEVIADTQAAVDRLKEAL